MKNEKQDKGVGEWALEQRGWPKVKCQIPHLGAVLSQLQFLHL